MSSEQFIDEIVRLFSLRGGEAYFGEDVSQLEHALQTAHLAVEAGASPSLVTAALLHDAGHLIHGLGEEVADQGIDAQHERAGAAWLQTHFGLPVSEPVRLHVQAKRYLCCVDRSYFDRLSPASVESLALQGGSFSEAETAEFEANPFFREAVMLRRWDDEAKIPGLAVPDLESYRTVLATVLAPQGR